MIWIEGAVDVRFLLESKETVKKQLGVFCSLLFAVWDYFQSIWFIYSMVL